MKTVEFGKENHQVIMLLHGGGLSWWNYRETAKLLSNDFHVVLPILDGHAESDRDFISIEANASSLIEMIDKRFNGKILLLGGLSLGAQIVCEMISQRSNVCEHTVIESALVYPMKATHALIKPSIEMSYGLIQKEWFSKLQFSYLRINSSLYDEYVHDSRLISKQNLISILKANSDYQLKDRIKLCQSKVLILAGSKEQKIMIKSAKRLNQQISGSVMEIKEGLHHGEFSLNDAESYSCRIREFIGQEKTQSEKL